MGVKPGGADAQMSAPTLGVNQSASDTYLKNEAADDPKNRPKGLENGESSSLGMPYFDIPLPDGEFNFDPTSGLMVANKKVVATKENTAPSGSELISALAKIMDEKVNTPEAMAMSSLVTMLQQQQVLLQQQQMHLTTMGGGGGSIGGGGGMPPTMPMAMMGGGPGAQGQAMAQMAQMQQMAQMMAMQQQMNSIGADGRPSVVQPSYLPQHHNLPGERRSVNAPNLMVQKSNIRPEPSSGSTFIAMSMSNVANTTQHQAAPSSLQLDPRNPDSRMEEVFKKTVVGGDYARSVCESYEDVFVPSVFSRSV
jgi:hypothetical protein